MIYRHSSRLESSRIRRSKLIVTNLTLCGLKWADSISPQYGRLIWQFADPPELKARTINRVRTFLKAHQPSTAAR